MTNPSALKFGGRGHVRAFKAAIPRWRDRTSKRADSDFAILNTAALHGNGLSRFIHRHERKDTVCDPALLARHITRHPYLHGNSHRRSPNSLYPRITPNGVPYPYRFEKRHP